MTAVFNAIVALAVAFPKLLDLIEQLSVWYATVQEKRMKQENKDAILLALVKHDQRAIEKAMGYSKPGEPSGIPGTVIIDHPPPGV